MRTQNGHPIPLTKGLLAELVARELHDFVVSVLSTPYNLCPH